MTRERLSVLDGIASAAANAKTVVYTDDTFPLSLRGLADWSPRCRHYEIVLNPALLTWLCGELEEIFYHEACHIRCGHVSTGATVNTRAASYRKVVQKTAMLGDGETLYTTVGAVRRELEAEAESRRLRAEWPFNAYRLWRLLTQKETFP